MMQQAMAGLVDDCCHVFIDDIVVHSKNYEEHLYDLKSVWDRLTEYGIKLKGSKCEMVKLQVPFLGHVVCKDGIKVDPAKIEKIQNCPAPKTRKQLRQFLGLTGYYRRFVENYVEIAGPLYEALKMPDPHVRFESVWTDECQKAFEQLKVKMTITPVLIYPDLQKREYILFTDACKWGSAIS